MSARTKGRGLLSEKRKVVDKGKDEVEKWQNARISFMAHPLQFLNIMGGLSGRRRRKTAVRQ